MTDETIPPLTGLKGSHPLGFMAALGLLRCLTEKRAFGLPRLHWQPENGWVAVLTTQQPATREQLIEFLTGYIEQRGSSPEFTWADKISAEPSQFVTKAKEFINEITPLDRSVADFFSAFGCELIANNGKLRRTAFDMTDANQGLMKNFREVIQSLVTPKRGRTTGAEAFEQALFGPWKYEDEEHSIGWDPSTESLYALRADDPTASKNKKKRSVRAAIYLAAESLPLFPCVPVGSRLATRGFTEIRRSRRNQTEENFFLSWPIWCDPLCLEEVRSVLALKKLTLETPPLRELRGMGIAEVFRSHKVKTGGDQGNRYIFRTAYPCTEEKEV